VKLDPDGCELAYRQWHVVQIPARTRTVHDVIGAGDQFIAALTVAHIAGLDWPAAAKFANTAAGLQVKRHGCVPLTLAELLQELEHELRNSSVAADAILVDNAP
jgi:bifunctional ADP-heptose synthase (sugar kinase/adenylyltransferase)